MLLKVTSACTALPLPDSFTGVREVSFSPVNSNSNSEATDSLGLVGLGAGWLVGASGGLLGLAYVLAALLYMRSRRMKNKKR